MRNLEWRRHQEDLLYHVVAYLVSLDKLFDDQAKILREQISRAEQAEVTVRMHQVRVAQAKARTIAAINSEAVAHESLRRIQDQRMQEWTNSGTPVPTIAEAQVLLGTPLVGWGGTIETPPTPPAVTNNQQRPQQRKLRHNPKRMETPRVRMTMSYSFHWKCTQHQKMARLASSIPPLTCLENEAAMV
jgi:hypothetical protein